MVDENVISDDQVDPDGDAPVEVSSATEAEAVAVEADVPVEASEVESSAAEASEVAEPEAVADEPEEELNEFGFSAEDMVDDDDDDEEDDEDEDVSPIEEFVEEAPVVADEDIEMRWYILKVQVNRENTICDALTRRVKVAGLEQFFGEILVPTEDVREFNKAGKQRIVKRKLYPGYIVVNMVINDDSWFLVRETSGIGDFTGAAGKPAALDPEEIKRIIATTKPQDAGKEDAPVKTAIKFKVGDHDSRHLCQLDRTGFAFEI